MDDTIILSKVTSEYENNPLYINNGKKNFAQTHTLK